LAANDGSFSTEEGGRGQPSISHAEAENGIASQGGANGLENRSLPEMSIEAIRVLKDSNAKLLNNDTLNLLETTKSSIRDGRDDEKGHDSISLAESAQWKSLPNQLMIFGPDEDFWLELSC